MRPTTSEPGCEVRPGRAELSRLSVCLTSLSRMTVLIAGCSHPAPQTTACWSKRNSSSRRFRSMELAACTDVPAAVDLPFDAGAAYALDPAVAIRPEPFGALAYHYG